MQKPTFASVTDVPCSCGHMERAAHNPDSPIVFDKDLNEFNFEYALPGHEQKGHGESIIVHFAVALRLSP